MNLSCILRSPRMRGKSINCLQLHSQRIQACHQLPVHKSMLLGEKVGVRRYIFEISPFFIVYNIINNYCEVIYEIVCLSY